MATTNQFAALDPIAPASLNTGRLASPGSLASYSRLTRQAYEDLRQYAARCQQHQLHLCTADRADIECFARDLVARSRSRATITLRNLQARPRSAQPKGTRTATFIALLERHELR
jgi:hypothetical protein